MINRRIAPDSQPIDTIRFIEPETSVLDNGIQVYSINAGSQELTRIDLIFDAGSWFQSSRLVAGLTNAFLNQGSEHFSALEIAERFDSCGAYLQPSADQHYGVINILTLNKHLDTILEITADLIKHPIFPEKEVNIQVAKRKQHFVIENSKVKLLAQKAFSQALFGQHHPYANNNRLEDFDALSRSDFAGFHQTHYTSKNCRIVVSGKLDASTMDLLNKHFGRDHWGTPVNKNKISYSIESSIQRQVIVEKPDSLQSAIRVGRLVPNRQEDDFFGLTILTTILGGYFGSRLMANIREDKGYTYGIGATVVTFPSAAYLTISSEVGHDVCRPALNEVYYEMDRLCQELVPDEELNTVKNYLLGELLRSFDGVFAMSSSFRVLLDSGLDYSHYRNYLEQVKAIGPETLRELARRYYDPQTLFEVIAG